MEREHLVKAFDEELRTVTDRVVEMGARVERLFDAAVDALVDGDINRASNLVIEDAQIDALDAEVEEAAIHVIARRQPVAADLRDLFSAVRIASDLERVGDLSKNIAKRAVLLGHDRPKPGTTTVLEDMAVFAKKQLHDVIEAYIEGDSAKAEAVLNGDVELDTYYSACFRQLITYMMEDTRSITSCAHLLHVAKSVERVGDHATNIAEYVLFRVKGEIPRGRPKGADLEDVLARDLGKSA